MKKFGSDPEGSRVNNLERSEAENQIKSAKYHDDAPTEIVEEKAQPDLSVEKDWTPLYENTEKDPPNSKQKSDQSE